jgi:hypothetical protein
MFKIFTTLCVTLCLGISWIHSKIDENQPPKCISRVFFCFVELNNFSATLQCFTMQDFFSVVGLHSRKPMRIQNASLFGELWIQQLFLCCGKRQNIRHCLLRQLLPRSQAGFTMCVWRRWTWYLIRTPGQETKRPGTSRSIMPSCGCLRILKSTSKLMRASWLTLMRFLRNGFSVCYWNFLIFLS